MSSLPWAVLGEMLMMPCSELMRGARERARLQRRGQADKDRPAGTLPGPRRRLVCAPVTLPPGWPLTEDVLRVL